MLAKIDNFTIFMQKYFHFSCGLKIGFTFRKTDTPNNKTSYFVKKLENMLKKYVEIISRRK